jgi:hypothetical protein
LPLRLVLLFQEMVDDQALGVIASHESISLFIFVIARHEAICCLCALEDCHENPFKLHLK